MSLRRRLVYWLRNRVLALAHHPRAIDTKWHDRLEKFADRVIDPLVWV